MKDRLFIALAAILVISSLARPATAQGFATLGADAEGFAVPQRGAALEFPRDHGPHPEYRVEWWYVTATLTGEDGQEYGIQWTLFRSAMEPGEGVGWSSPQVWMGHAGLTSRDAHFSAERMARGGTGQAGVWADPFKAWIDEWSMTSRATANQDALDALDLTARGADFSYELRLQAHGPLVLHGDSGFSVKSADGQASYYYSQPFYDVEGHIVTQNGPVAVTGQGWLDREWFSQVLAEDQSGWDWVSLSFESGYRLMAAQVRGTEIFTAGTWIAPDGTVTAIADGAVRFRALENARVEGRDVPVRWQIDWPDGGVSVTTTPLNPQSWMDTSVAYWEGPLRFTGTHSGRGYLEMTGY